MVGTPVRRLMIMKSFALSPRASRLSTSVESAGLDKVTTSRLVNKSSRLLGSRPEPPEVERASLGIKLTDRGFLVILVAPGLLLLLSVVLYPLIASLVSAFFKQSLVIPGRKFVGFNNVFDVLNGNFWTLLNQTMIFTIGSTVSPFLIGLGLALVLNQRFRGQRFLRGAFLVPWLIPSVVVSFLWKWIFDANDGVLNGVLTQLHLIDHPIAWLYQVDTARVALIVAKTWNSFPWIMVMLLAVLQTVPGELQEAAALDGAGIVRRFSTVTWPHIRGVAVLVALLEFIWNFQNFDIIYVLTGGGPAGSTDTFATAVYNTTFKSFDLGHAGAIGLLWMVLLMILVFVFVRLSERGENS